MQLVTNSLKYLSPIETIELSNHRGSAEEETHITDKSYNMYNYTNKNKLENYWNKW